jgi:hypothetical protein
MKKINLLFIITILTLSFTTITAQFTSVQNGGFGYPGTWSTNPDATAIPDSNSSVIINHTISGSGECKDLTINENGKIYSGEGFTIYGNLYNNGEIRDDPNHGSDQLSLTILGNIYNNGLYITGKTTFERNPEHHLQSLNGNPINLGISGNRNAASVFVVDNVVYISGSLMLGGSKLLLPGVNDTLVLFNNGLVDGGVIECNNNIIVGKGSNGTIGFHGIRKFNPKQTYVKDAILEGYINFNGEWGDSSDYTITFLGNVINNGTITTAPFHMGNIANIFIEGEFINNGQVKSQSDGLALRFVKNGNITNNGELLDNKMIFYNSHTFINNSDSVSVSEIKGLDSNSTVTIPKDLLFNVDAMINMNGGKMVLTNSAKLDGFGMKNSVLEANGSVISTRNNSNIFLSTIKDVKVNNVKIYYTTKLLGETEIIENGVLSIASGDVNVKGNIINNGTIIDPDNLTIIGNITNNGIWKAKANLTGDFVNNGEVTIYRSLKINGTVTNKNAWKGNLEVVGDVINEGIIDTVGTFKVEGNITNSAIMGTGGRGSFEVDGNINNSGILDCSYFRITGNINNTGSWNSYQTTLFGTNDQYIYMPSDSIISATYAVLFDALLSGSNYQWYRNDEILEGEKSRYLYILSPGLQPDNATYNCKVDSSFSRNIIIQSLTEVNDEKDVKTTQLPTEFSLSQNYPNPFNPSTVIEFALPQSANVSLTIYNSIGEKVAELLKGNMNSGKHSVTFDASNLSSGIYFYRISAIGEKSNFIKVEKMILLK